jgi:hypothetical protein
MNRPLFQLGLLSLAIGASVSAQTYTAIMSGENSTKFSFLNGTGSRTTVTSVQSPFGFPNTITGANDTMTFPSGSSGGSPEPWWFYYGTCTPPASGVCAFDLTGAYIPRGPSYGQISSQKSSVIGVWANAAFDGTASNGNSTVPAGMIEAIYFTVRDDYQGQQEIGIARQMNPYAYCNGMNSPNNCGSIYNSGDYLFGYWYTNDNCGPANATGSPTTTLSVFASCQTSQANGSVQAVGSGPSGGSLLQVGAPAGFAFICGPSTTSCAYTGASYVFQTYIFWASWDSTYKQRVEVWDSTFSTPYVGLNLDTTNGSVNLGLTTSGTSGYITVGTELYDPSGPTISSSGIQLSVSQVKMITP